MRKILLLFLATTLSLGLANLCFAENELKPVVAISFSGYDKLMGDLGAIGRLAGNPNLAQGFEFVLQLVTQGKGLAGLDTKRPWGVLLVTDGSQCIPYGFLPVTELKRLVELAQLNPQGADKIALVDGVYEIPIGPPTIYVEQRGKWAVMTLKRSDLAQAPAKPLEMLGDLPKNYDLAAWVSFKNLVGQQREQVLAQLQAAMEVAMAQRSPEESDVQYNRRVRGIKQARQQLVTLINEAEQLTLGWTVDPGAGTSHFDFEVKAASGTNLAKQYAAMKPGKTNFAGFQLPGAALTANWCGTLTDADVARVDSALMGIRTAIVEELDDQRLSDQRLKQTAHFLDELVDLLKKNIDKKQSDGGAAVLLGPAKLTVVAGTVIADPARTDKLLKELLEEIQKNDRKAVSSIKLDAETYQGVRFHKLSVPTPKPELTPLVGDKLEVILGIGGNQLLVAAGRDAAKTLKKVIDDSKAATGKEVPPLTIKVSLGTLAKFVAQVADEEDVKAKAAMIAGFLENAGKKDHVTLTATPIPQGVRVRLEFEQGLLKALGSLASMGGPAMLIGPGPGTPPAPHP